jgi:hypothetical protein
MSHVLEFDSEEKIIRVTVHGELTDACMSELYSSVHEFLSSHDVRGGILDLTPVTALSVSVEMVRRLAKAAPLFEPPQVRVIVASGDLVFGMARLFQISRSEIHSELFVVHTLDEAYRIHGLTSPHFVVEHSIDER